MGSAPVPGAQMGLMRAGDLRAGLGFTTRAPVVSGAARKLIEVKIDSVVKTRRSLFATPQ